MHALLPEIEAFLAKHELSESNFGVSAANDKNLVRDLRTGRRMWPETEEKVRQFMANYQPQPRADAA
jgi:hypothetical protein